VARRARRVAAPPRWQAAAPGLARGARLAASTLVCWPRVLAPREARRALDKSANSPWLVGVAQLKRRKPVERGTRGVEPGTQDGGSSVSDEEQRRRHEVHRARAHDGRCWTAVGLGDAARRVPGVRRGCS
jgi:hypothetical protein